METPAAFFVPADGMLRWRLPRVSPVGRLIGLVLAVATVFAGAVVVIAGMGIDIAGFGRFAVLALALAGLRAWTLHRAMDARLGDGALIVGTGIIALMACGIISNAGLRLGASPIDESLAAIDAAAGIDVERVVRAFAAHPATMAVLSAVYNISGAVVVGLIAIILAADRRALAWELVATVVIAMQVVAALSIMAPAIGAMTHFDMLDLQGHGLPRGAGVYHLEAFARFHSGSAETLRLSEMSGLVTFPSFHTVLGLMALQALAASRLRWVGVAWAAGVIVSTIPIGGHYVTDLVAGFAIWAGCAWVVRRINTPSA